MQQGHPTVFWISGLFFPQGFLTGVLQNYARETKTPVSDIIFKYTVTDKFADETSKHPQVKLIFYNFIILIRQEFILMDFS